MGISFKAGSSTFAPSLSLILPRVVGGMSISRRHWFLSICSLIRFCIFLVSSPIFLPVGFFLVGGGNGERDRLPDRLPRSLECVLDLWPELMDFASNPEFLTCLVGTSLALAVLRNFRLKTLPSLSILLIFSTFFLSSSFLEAVFLVTSSFSLFQSLRDC